MLCPGIGCALATPLETTCDDTPSGRASTGDAFPYTMTDGFLTSERVQSTLENSMVDIHDQESLNQIYDEFFQTLKTELVYRKVSLGDRHHKPWWNDCLATLRKNARTALKRWEMNKQNPSLKDFFLKAQKSFDLEVRRTKRAYHRHLHDKLLSNYRTKPRDFWRQIDKLGIHQERQKKGLPNKLKDLNGVIVHNTDVLHLWKSYFHSLFQGSKENLTPTNGVSFIIAAT